MLHHPEQVADKTRCGSRVSKSKVISLHIFAAFEVPYCWTPIKGKADMRFVDSLDIHASTKHVWAPPLTEVQQYGASNAAMRSKYVAE